MSSMSKRVGIVGRSPLERDVLQHLAGIVGPAQSFDDLLHITPGPDIVERDAEVGERVGGDADDPWAEPRRETKADRSRPVVAVDDMRARVRTGDRDLAVAVDEIHATVGQDPRLAAAVAGPHEGAGQTTATFAVHRPLLDRPRQRVGLQPRAARPAPSVGQVDGRDERAILALGGSRQRGHAGVEHQLRPTEHVEVGIA